MLLFSDLHLRDETADVVLGQVLPGLRAEMNRLGEHHAVCLGDVFHIRNRVDVALINGLRDELLRWSGIFLDILPGNHDQYTVDGRHALEYLADILDPCGGAVRVHSEPGWDGTGFWMPYRKDPWALAKVEGRGRTLFAHLPFKGAMLAANQVDTDGLDGMALGGWAYVFAGHYHMHQQIPGFIQGWYVGSPYQVSAGEAGQVKGFVQWDGRAAPVFHARRWGPCYHVLAVQKGGDLDLSNVRAGDEVRVLAASGVNVASVAQALRTVGVRHTVTPEVDHVESRLAVGAGASLTEYARSYVEAQAGELDKAQLMALFETVTR